MHKTNSNFKARAEKSSQSFRNKGSYLGCVGCVLREDSHNLMRPARNKQERTRACLRNYGWILIVLTVFGLFSYLTLLPNQAFATYDRETRKLKDITTMQDMNAKICENTTEIGTQYQLEDTRDGKKYYVAKLQDGNCWMTQNLAYSGTNKDGTKREDIGTPCTLSGLTTNSTCSGWTNSNTEKYFAIGEHRESHDSRGNYYSWPAAVAGDTSTTEPKQGICPDGWQLPTSGSNTGSKSFVYLLTEYGLQSSTSGTGKDGKSYTITGSPLYFQHNGLIYSGALSNVGSSGIYRSSTPDTSAASLAYVLDFDNSNIRPSSVSSRSRGFPVRCVAADIYPEKPPITDNDTANVAITVSPVISIDVTKDANDMTVDFTKVATSTIVARVGSNQSYKVMLSTDKSNLTNPDTDKTIPMIPSDQTIIKGTSSWGIKKLSSPTDTTVNENTVYSPVGINGNKELFYTSASAASEDLTFPVAIAVDSRLPSGQYSTQVTLTAVAM